MNTDENCISDADIWSRFRSGDKQAFAILFERYSPILNHYGNKTVLDRDVVEDCVQDLFIYLWNHRKALADVSSVKYYLIVCLRRRLRDHVVVKKREQSLRRALMEENTSRAVLSDESLMAGSMNNERLILSINHEIQNLPERQRQAFTLRYIEQKSYDEITTIMNINYQSSRKHVYKALLSLKDRFVAIMQNKEAK